MRIKLNITRNVTKIPKISTEENTISNIKSDEVKIESTSIFPFLVVGVLSSIAGIMTYLWARGKPEAAANDPGNDDNDGDDNDGDGGDNDGDGGDNDGDGGDNDDDDDGVPHLPQKVVEDLDEVNIRATRSREYYSPVKGSGLKKKNVNKHKPKRGDGDDDDADSISIEVLSSEDANDKDSSEGYLKGEALGYVSASLLAGYALYNLDLDYAQSTLSGISANLPVDFTTGIFVL